MSAAARQLGVEHTTVSRRIQALEQSLGAPLFIRADRVYALTEAGEKLLPVAMTMERTYAGIQGCGIASPFGTNGLVRIGCTEGYGSTILPRHLARFQHERPDVSIDLLVLPRAIQLPRNEADLVITIDRPTRGPYTVAKLSDYILNLYASADYLEKHSDIRHVDDLAGHNLINYVDYFSVAKDLPLFRNRGVAVARGLHSTSLIAQREAVIAGAGIAILPRYMVREQPMLRAILADEVTLSRTYWLVTQNSAKDLPRMRLLSEFLRKAARSEHL